MSERLAPEQGDSLEGIVEPAENAALVGHEAQADALVSAYQSGKMHHALLLTGPKGIGKATFAFHVARFLLENPDAQNQRVSFGHSDPASAIFRQVASGAHPGVLHLTRPFDERSKKFRTSITVDEMRKVSKFLSLRSHDNSYRIVIVDPAEDMNRNAANALLKNLEEPPPRVLFMLISHSPGSLLPTIRSRCQVVRMSPLDGGELDTVLGQSGIGRPNDASQHEILLAGAGGSARQAMLLAEHGGFDIISAADAYMSSQRKDVAHAHKLADAVSGRDQEVRFEILNAHLLDRIASASSDAAAQGDIRRAARIAEFWEEARAAVSETETYNLDKRQHVVGLLDRVAIALA